LISFNKRAVGRVLKVQSGEAKVRILMINLRGGVARWKS